MTRRRRNMGRSHEGDARLRSPRQWEEEKSCGSRRGRREEPETAGPPPAPDRAGSAAAQCTVINSRRGERGRRSGAGGGLLLFLLLLGAALGFLCLLGLAGLGQITLEFLPGILAFGHLALELFDALPELLDSDLDLLRRH